MHGSMNVKKKERAVLYVDFVVERLSWSFTSSRVILLDYKLRNLVSYLCRSKTR